MIFIESSLKKNLFMVFATLVVCRVCYFSVTPALLKNLFGNLLAQKYLAIRTFDHLKKIVEVNFWTPE